ncbi:MAG: hypothetical protein WCT18_03635 [Patescibacteria group bacterium]
MKILIFVEKNIIGLDHEVVVGVKEKLNHWIENGAEIEFLTGINKFMALKKLDDQIKEFGFSKPKIHDKKDEEKFVNVIRKIKPDLLIEKVGNSDEAKTFKEKLPGEIKVLLLEEDATLELLSDDPKELLAMASEDPVEAIKDNTY